MQTIVTVTFMRSSENLKCLVLSNHLFNSDSVHSLLENSTINFLLLYIFFCLNSLTKILIVCRKYHIDCINKRHFRSSDCSRLCNDILVTEIFCHWYLIINNSTKNDFLKEIWWQFSNLLRTNSTKHMKYCSNSFRFHFYCTMFRGLLFYQTQCSCIIVCACDFHFD